MGLWLEGEAVTASTRPGEREMRGAEVPVENRVQGVLLVA